jgi:hypothetical protein
MSRKNLARALAGCLIAFLVLTASSCDDGGTSANQRDANATANQFDIYTNAQPIHTYNFSMPRDVMIQIYDATMVAHNTWTVWYALNSTPIDSCPSIGYPIPGGTQLTNPSAVSHYGTSGGGYSNEILPQGEPDGLFPPSNGLGTWVLCVRNGKVEPTYVEPNVVTYGHPVKIENGVVVDAGGDSSVTVQVRNSVIAPPSTTPSPVAPTKKASP